MKQQSVLCGCIVNTYSFVNVPSTPPLSLLRLRQPTFSITNFLKPLTITFDTSAINYTGKRLLDNPFDSPRSIVSRLIKIKIVRGEGGRGVINDHNYTHHGILEIVLFLLAYNTYNNARAHSHPCQKLSYYLRQKRSTFNPTKYTLTYNTHCATWLYNQRILRYPTRPFFSIPLCLYLRSLSTFFERGKTERRDRPRRGFVVFATSSATTRRSAVHRRGERTSSLPDFPPFSENNIVPPVWRVAFNQQPLGYQRDSPSTQRRLIDACQILDDSMQRSLPGNAQLSAQTAANRLLVVARFCSHLNRICDYSADTRASIYDRIENVRAKQWEQV